MIGQEWKRKLAGSVPVNRTRIASQNSERDEGWGLSRRLRDIQVVSQAEDALRPSSLATLSLHHFRRALALQ
jgi:hypothetical protein